MILSAEQRPIASLLSQRVEELANAGRDDVEMFAQRADYMLGFKRLLDTSTRGEMDALCEQFAGFYRYAKILERIAAGMQSGEIKSRNEAEGLSSTVRSDGDLAFWREDWDALIELLQEKEFACLLSPCMMRVEKDGVNEPGLIPFTFNYPIRMASRPHVSSHPSS